MSAAEEAIWISEADAVFLMDLGEAIGALERGLLLESQGAAHNMIKTHVAWEGATLHAIGAVFPSLRLCGTKTWTHTAGGATPMLLLFDSGTGALKAIIEAFALGQMRTAAVSGVATRWLAKPDADELAIVGTGKQALAQVAAVLLVRPVRRVRVFGRDEERRKEFAAKVRNRFSVEVSEYDSVRAAVAGASIITLATRATEPILFSDMVQRGVHINSIGAIEPARAEIAQDVLARATQVVTDSVAQAQKLSREMIECFDGVPNGWLSVRPLADLVAARVPRKDSDDLSVFKALGVGISDLSLGVELYRRAMEQEKGYRFAPPLRSAPRLSGNVESAFD